MIYGEQQIQIIRDTTDLIGVRVLVLSQLWQPSTSNPLVALSEKPAAPAVPGGVIIVGEQSMPGAGAMRTTWTFQGINGDGKSVTFKDRQHSIDFGFEPGFAQIPIQQHPDFKTLLDAYGGFPGNDGATVVWDPDNTGPAPTRNSGLGDKTKTTETTKTNPMYGIQDYFRMEGTYRFRYAARDLPAEFGARDGMIVETQELPGKPPPTHDGRNWLVVPAPHAQRGIIIDITELYWLSGPKGWPAPVYGKASALSTLR